MKPYIPASLPFDNIDCDRLIKKVGLANAALARYDGLLQGIINPGILLSPLMTQEAVLSSKIEGTQATIDEVLEYEAGTLTEERRVGDVQEILNYREAVRSADRHIADYPISLSLILGLHKILLQSVRGKDKTPGEFRKDQNWIGSPGCKIEDATFVPPSPFHLPEALNNWEQYLKVDDIDILIQTAIVHAQFELIHPFKDGNGRIGRLLIPLFLFQKRALSSPMFYLSQYLENSRDEYYYRLQEISRHQDWNGWIEFFLEAIIAQAKENTSKVQSILKIYEQMKSDIIDATHSQYALPALDAIFSRPIFSTKAFIDDSKIPKQTAITILNKLAQNNIIKVLKESRGRTPTVYVFPKLFEIVG